MEIEIEIERARKTEREKESVYEKRFSLSFALSSLFIALISVCVCVCNGADCVTCSHQRHQTIEKERKRKRVCDKSLFFFVVVLFSVPPCSPLVCVTAACVTGCLVEPGRLTFEEMEVFFAVDSAALHRHLMKEL
jgi:predicted nucleic acid-binding Zn ribbon protein